ncbi:AMP-binding protein [Pseudomonas sp. NA13]
MAGGRFLNIEDVDWSDSTLPFDPVIDDVSLAYMLFTSGSTGLPKGVMVRRQNLAYFLSAINEVINFSAWGALVSTTTYGFDISILEFFCPWLKVERCTWPVSNRPGTDRRSRNYLINVTVRCFKPPQPPGDC